MSFRGPYVRGLKPEPVPEAEAGNYPFNIPAVADLGALTFDQPVTFFIGENGSGKSTVLEAIAIKAGFNPEGGTRHMQFAHRPTESQLHEHLRLIRSPRREKTGFFLRGETLFNMATEVERQELYEYGWEGLHERSHGEALLWLANHRFGPNGLFLLDEPETALSPSRQLSFLTLIHDRVKNGGQFIIATHSPILLAYPQARIFEFGPDGVSITSLEESEPFRITRDFLNRPSSFLKHLLTEPDA